MAAFSVALVGLDGVGKTTVAERLGRDYPERIRYVYMGDNLDSGTHMLPTTRWWHSRKTRAAERNATASANGGRPSKTSSLLRPARKTLGLINRVMDETYRQIVATYYVRRGLVVVFDRHFILDYHHGDERAGSSVKRRVRSLLRRILLSPPDLVIVLDAPAEVAFSRKGEFTPEHLERRRAEYLGLRERFPNTAVVDANREPSQVIRDVHALIERFAERGRPDG